jgi:AcrR family transcriptional regulator
MSENEDAVPPAAKAAVAGAVRAALAKHGYARLTTAKIAAESEKSEAGLYYYYDSKDEMIAAFLETAADYLAEELAAVEADDPEARLRAACDRLFVDRADEGARGVNVAVMELLSHAPYNETLRGPLEAMQGNTLDHLVEILAEGVDDGVFREVDPEGVAAFLLAAANGSTGFYLALGMDDAGAALHDQVDAYVDWLVTPADGS